MWGSLLAVPLLLLASCVPGKRIVDGHLERSARSILSGAGLSGVSADFDWGRGTLTGPEADRDAALAVVGSGIAKRKRYGLRYVADGTAAAPTTTAAPAPTTAVAATTSAAPATTAARTTVATTAAPTTAAATTVATTAAPTTAAPAASFADVTTEVAGSRVVLRGRVPTQAHRTALVAAATEAFGAGKVDDQLTVAAASATAAGQAAIERYAVLLGALAPRLSRGTATLVDTVITVRGTGFNASAADGLRTAIGAANGGGVTASGTIDVAAADPKQLEAELAALLGRSGINFEPDSAEIDAASIPVLDTAAASIVALPAVRIRVEGHTDAQGSAAANQDLSERRAAAVVAYLVAHGVNPAQVTSAGYGPDRPIADNATPEGRAANRRIEFVVTGS